jgi:tetratricopeptide (TPR) repeat protein
MLNLASLSSRSMRAAALCMLLGAITLVYLGHFHNGFHFDDYHTVVQNPYIRSLHNVPRFFADARPFSVLPSNRVYRPIVSTSLAIDYWLGRGLKPFYFHLSTFVWFLLQVVLIYLLACSVYNAVLPDRRNWIVAILSASIYGLHPAMAETVNYVIQRGDLYSTLGVIAALTVYAKAPRLRRFGIYLIPFVAAVLSKPPALVFPAILFLYVYLFESEPPHRLRRAIIACIPAFLCAVALAWLTLAMTPRDFRVRIHSAFAYRITQPLVALRYFRTFFLPGDLTADTDHAPIPSIWQQGAWGGFLFVGALIAAGVLTARKRELRPIAFGIGWFLLAMLPTSIFALSEVENDHRMFFPFVGLVIGVPWPLALWIYHHAPRRAFAACLAVLCAVQLTIFAAGTVGRNRVWRTEASLWRDVAIKSPKNPRGLVNYGGTLLASGDAGNAIRFFQRALTYSPHYALAEVNMGIACAQLHRNADAEAHFLRALRLAPDNQQVHYFYAKWLADNEREREAIEQLRGIAKMNPDFLPAAYSLMQIYGRRGNWRAVKSLAEYVLKRFPYDLESRSYQLLAQIEEPGSQRRLRDLTPDALIDLSDLYFRIGKIERCIDVLREAIKQRPAFPEAYNNLSAAYGKLQDWQASIDAAQRALEYRPGFAAASKNLARAERERKKAAAQ